jgi:hypothetical protein
LTIRNYTSRFSKGKSTSAWTYIDNANIANELTTYNRKSEWPPTQTVTPQKLEQAIGLEYPLTFLQPFIHEH